MFFENKGLLNVSYFLENVHLRTVKILGNEENSEEHKKNETHNNIKSIKMIIVSNTFS